MGTVVPILGGLIAIVMYCSPLKAAYMARRSQNIGELNPIPFAVTFMNTACWNAYGLAAPDYNMFLPNIPGVIAALYTSITCYALASTKMQDIMLSIICCAAFVVMLLAVMTRFVCSATQGKLLWGFTCNIITILYYGAPLSSTFAVVRRKDSSSIYLPTCIANLVNAALWIAYGFAVGDPFIWVPNGVGGVFAIALIALCIIYPRKGKVALPAVEHKVGSSRDNLLDPQQLEEGGIKAHMFTDSPAMSVCGGVDVEVIAGGAQVAKGASGGEVVQRRTSTTQ